MKTTKLLLLRLSSPFSFGTMVKHFRRSNTSLRMKRRSSLGAALCIFVLSLLVGNHRAQAQGGVTQNRVVVPIADLPLHAELERDIFKEIVGRRWQEDRGQVRMASVAFGSRIENKRHLVSMLDRLVLSAQRLATEVRQKAAEQSAGKEEAA